MYKFRDFGINNIMLGLDDKGKSNFFREIIKDFSKTYDKQVFLIDIYGEYDDLNKNIEIDNYYFDSLKSSINPLDLRINLFDDSMLFRKIDFLFSFFQTILNRKLSLWEKRLLDKELIELYRPYIKYLKDNGLLIDRDKCPILVDFYEQIRNNDDLKELRLALEVFIFGKYKHIFNNKTNIKDSFIIRFDIKLDRELQELVYLNCLDYIYLKSMENLDNQFKTFIFIEENYFFLKEWFFDCFKSLLIRMRSIGGILFLNYSSVQNLMEDDNGKALISLVNKFYLFKMNLIDASFLKKSYILTDSLFKKVQELKVGEKIEI